jgi:PAS domain S-box-containing protein
MSEIRDIEKKIESASGKEKVDLLNELGAMLQDSDPAAAREYAQWAKAYAKEIKYESGIARSYLIEGFTDWTKGDYDLAMKAYNEALEICECINDKSGIADCYRKIGISYCDQLDYDQAMEYHLRAIEICEEIDDQKSIASNYTDISYIHWKRGDQDQAIEYLQKALTTFEEIGDKFRAATALNNIGATYEQQNKFDQALEYYHRAIKIWEESGNTKYVNVAHTYNNIGNIYKSQKKYPEALEYQKKSLEIWEFVKSKSGMAMVYINLGSLYTDMGDQKSASELLYRALELAKQIKDLDKEMVCYKSLADLYDSTNNPDKAYDYLEQYTTLREKLFNQEMNRQITEMQTRYESEKSRREAEIYRLKNVELANEIKVRKKAEAELNKYQDHLEDLVGERTFELERSNIQLAEEIVERTQAEQALRESEERYRLLVETMNEALASVDSAARFTFVNPKMCEMLDYSQDEMIGHHILEFFDDENRKHMKKQLEKRRDGKSGSYDIEWTAKDGRKVPTIISPQIISDVAGNYLGSFAVITDITERKISEEKLKETAEKLREEQDALKEKNIALNTILDHIENAKVDYKHELSANVENLLSPIIEKLKENDGHLKEKEISILEDSLKTIVGRDIDQFQNNYDKLTPREMDICERIKQGMSSKEIAESLSISVETIHKHRDSIRRKLQIQHKNINLSAYLRSK